MIDTSVRVTPVGPEELDQLDQLELARVETLLAGFPPTSVVSDVLRDVVEALSWATSPHGTSRRLELSVVRREVLPARR